MRSDHIRNSEFEGSPRRWDVSNWMKAGQIGVTAQNPSQFAWVFGGKQMEEGPSKYEGFLRRQMSSVEQAVFIDVHTGLGKFAEDMILVEWEDHKRLKSIYGKVTTTLQPNQNREYRILGGMDSMIFRLFPKHRPAFIC